MATSKLRPRIGYDVLAIPPEAENALCLFGPFRLHYVNDGSPFLRAPVLNCVYKTEAKGHNTVLTDSLHEFGWIRRDDDIFSEYGNIHRSEPRSPEVVVEYAKVVSVDPPRRVCDPNGEFHVEIQGTVVCWRDTDQDLLQMAGSQGGRGSKQIAAAYEELVAQVFELSEETIRLRAELARVSTKGEDLAQRVDDHTAALFKIDEKVTQESALLRGTAGRLSGLRTFLSNMGEMMEAHLDIS